jgi:DUF971 family protein
MPEYLEPVAIVPVGQWGVRITWNDGVITNHSHETLRRNCPCAFCQEQFKEKVELIDTRHQLRILSEKAVPEKPQIKRIDWVGNYALKLTWQDGHDAGMYRYEILKGLDEPVPENGG